MDTVNHKFYVHIFLTLYFYILLSPEKFLSILVPLHTVKLGALEIVVALGRKAVKRAHFLLLLMPGMVLRFKHIDIINSRYICIAFNT